MDRKDESNVQDSLTRTNTDVDSAEQREGAVRGKQKVVWIPATENDMHIVRNIPTVRSHLNEKAPSAGVK